ncbi:MAG: pentapeptide repeat-containing protein [Cyanobacteria bacterium Co-bin13]|nr:pentapeptide repeat-containing protein [Cyanobacteria bacterium Co-bin13]
MTRSYARQSLRGRSFKGQDLRQVDFSEADIRGANFSDAVLTGANFTGVRAELPPLVVLALGAVLLLLLVLDGFIVAYGSAFAAFVTSLLNTPAAAGQQALPIAALLTLTAFVWVTLRRGLGAALGAFAIATSAAVALVSALGTGDLIAALLVTAMALAGMIAAVIVGAVMLAMLLGLVPHRGVGLVISGLAFAVGALPGGMEGVQGAPPEAVGNALVITAITTLGLSALMGYIGLCTQGNDPRYRLISPLVISLSSRWGTCFRGADLSDADFSQAKLTHSDFRRANLSRTRWASATGLSQARVEHTYLADPQICRLVTTQNGQSQTFDGKDLRQVNLQGARLADASFIGADLSEANLAQADLSRAKLVRAQLYRANLSTACFTGAYIQDWGISTETDLDQVVCDYIYMRLPSRDDPDPCRKPDNRAEVFQSGDFADFIAPILKTLDLYQQQHVDPRSVAKTYKTIDLFHHAGLDPGAAALALQQLAAQHPEAGIEVLTLEGRGQDKIRLQARVSTQADRSQLSAQYFEHYRQFKALPYPDLQALLAGIAEKDSQIHRLGAMLEAAIQQPRFYVETYQNQGEFIVSQSKGNIRIGDVQGNISGLAAAGDSQTITGSALGDISGSVTTLISQLPETSDEQAQIKTLLTQLQNVIESEPTLAEEDKAEALEQVKTLAEASHRPQDGPLKKAAKTALKILKGTAAALPDATALIEGFNKLLPAIATLLSLV